MNEVIDVESYEIVAQSIVHDNIDVVLHSNALFRLDAFSYTVGDCLFDTFQVLLHFRYSSIELRNGLIDYFLSYFKNGDAEALQSYGYKIFFGSCMEYKMSAHMFQKCGFLHLQFCLRMRGGFGEIHFVYDGCLTG
jgi:hypothetical protein